MRVTLLAGSYPPFTKGGGEVSSKYLAEGLARAGLAVHVLTCGPEAELRRENGVTVERVESPNIYWNYRPRRDWPRKLAWHVLDNINPRSLNLVRSHLVKSRADLLVTSTLENFGAASWHAAAFTGTPAIHVQRSHYVGCWRGTAFRKGRACAGRCANCRVLTMGRVRAARHVRGVIGIGTSISEWAAREGLFPNARHVTIPNFTPAFGWRGALRPDPVRPRFGYVGALTPGKGLECLADAWTRLDANKRPRLLIGGTGDDAFVTRIQARFDPDVTDFLGWVDTDRFLEKVDVLIVPSLWNETFGRVALEALTHGVPVIGSRAGGILDMVRHGENGFLFAPGSSEELANIVERFCAGKVAYADLSQQAIRTARSFSEEEVLSRYLDFFDEVRSVAQAA